MLLHIGGAWIGSGRSHGLLITHCLPTRYRKPIYFRRPGTREAVDYDPHTHTHTLFLSLSSESSSINTLFRVVSKTLRWCAACRAPPKNTRLRGPALSPSASELQSKITFRNTWHPGLLFRTVSISPPIQHSPLSIFLLSTSSSSSSLQRFLTSGSAHLSWTLRFFLFFLPLPSFGEKENLYTE